MVNLTKQFMWPRLLLSVSAKPSHQNCPNLYDDNIKVPKLRYPFQLVTVATVKNVIHAKCDAVDTFDVYGDFN